MMEATVVLAEASENTANGSGFKPEENRVTVSVVQNAADSESNCGLELMDKGTGDGGSNNVANEVEELEENGKSGSDGDGNGRWNVDKFEDVDYGFEVGDFVWGKIKSHPWWPGQVYDPRDASEFAIKHSQEGRLLVAFFGDGSCSWCLPSQLVPFIDNFRQMSSEGSSKSFVNAVQRAVDEIGRLVQTKMMCKCVPMEIRDHLARPVVANAGVKGGILVPEVDVRRLPIPEFEPDEILSKVVNFAKAVTVDNMFELGILRSWLSAFYYAKCGCPLAVYIEPLHVEGLEDKDENETVTNEFGDPIEVAVRGPREEEWASSPASNSAKTRASLDGKSYHKRKQRSVNELMEKGGNGKPKSRKSATLKEGEKDNGKSGRKRRVEGFESDNMTDENPKRIEVAVAEDASFEEVEIVTSPRERKKSKYLSPPYTDLNWKIVNSVPKMELDSDKKITKASSPVSELDDETSDDNKNQSKLTFSLSDIDIPVNELLSEMEFAALDPFYLEEKGSLDVVWGFVSAFRTSTYLQGSDYGKSKRVGRKRKSLPFLMANQEKDDDDEGKADRSRPKKAKRTDVELGRLQATDDLVSDVRVMREKLDAMAAVLEDCCSKLSTEEQSSLKEEMKCLMNNVETASEKVRVMAETVASP